MPTYEYACKACGHRLEAVQRFADAPLTVCPECGGELRKVFGAVGIVLKGSGFYKTDSRAGSGRSETKTDAATTANGDGTSSSSAEKAEGARPAGSNGSGTGAKEPSKAAASSTNSSAT